MTRAKFFEIVRFLIAGTTATLVNMIVLYALTEFAGVWYLLSLTVAFLIAFLISFTLQKFWTFAEKNKERIGNQAIWFFIVQMGGLLFNMLALYIAVDVFDLWYMGAQFFILLFIAASNFLIFRFVIFNKHV
ncbi:hypothetical protein A3D62_00255 [Candidatus Kaiserbacteria bacterium RIFCSPHIGHO2_02_FULL_49_11]|uniref:GtrA/DPMS transmembrane domain-containing protein n=1 Tax=Candidatus Kaiserbacteria bacterium RIFCSPHIGHO2_02_FULL_49_11 TaxID=1798489 RepID=A0A1F6D0U8_9BACT|nr:MAG: hypothetical protein A3D62_00255 [Candidatus Kaiserbacteria bacterium RIFCSPHIGHO2_02_FULL_49_11]